MTTTAKGWAPREGELGSVVVDLAAFRAGRAAARPQALPPGKPAGPTAVLSPRQATHRRRMLAHLLNLAAGPAKPA